MLNYQIALCNVFWDEQNIDTRYFGSVSEQTQYFETLTEGLYSPFRNVKWGNGVELSLVYTENTGRSIQEVLHCNYAIIKELDDEGNTLNYRYYFAYPRHDAGNNYIVDLSLDDIQTNYFKYKDTIAPCLINRACIDRWIVEDGRLFFNTQPNSFIFIDENFSAPKYLQDRINCEIIEANNDDLEVWLKEHVLCWCYLFIQGDIGIPSALDFRYNFAINSYNAPFKVLCAPVMRSGIISVPSDGTTISWQLGTLSHLANKYGSQVLDIKYSNKPPVKFILGVEDFNIENDILYLRTDNFEGLYFKDYQLESVISPIANLTDDNVLVNNLVNIQVNKRFSFSKSEVVGVPRNILLEPKLLSSSCLDLRLTQSGTEFSYSLLKLGTNVLKIRYFEKIQPGITRYFINIDNGYYTNTQGSYVGLVGSSDNSVIYSIDQLQNFLSQNKNFYTQRGVEIGMNYIRHKNILDTAQDIGNTYLQLDNMRNAPDTIHNANGDALLNISINGLDINLEVWGCFEKDLRLFSDMLFKNGYSLGIIGNVGDFDNIRKYFNYLECECDNISAPISNLEKNRLIEKLKAIRFWNTDTIQYTLENYENKLEDIDE